MRRHLPLLTLVPLLAGCPFIFGGPQLPRGDSQTTAPLPGSDADTDTDADADADTDTDTDPTTGLPTGTPTGTPGGTPTGTTPTGTGTLLTSPVITNLSAVWRWDVAELDIDIVDPNGDLNGGTITLDDGVTADVYSIPTDLDAWNPLGNATIVVPWVVGCGGDARVWQVRVTDFAGNQSTLELVSATVVGVTHGEGSDPTQVGQITPPFIACGDLSNNSDEDEVAFDFALGGAHTFTLHDLASPPEARDLELRDGQDQVVATATAPADPDSLSHVLNPGETYTIRVYAPGGGPGSAWSVGVHP